jgi:hypothetical protein
MAIKWSALEVAEAMNEVESFLTYAEKDLAQGEAKAREAARIPNLPQYMTQRLGRLIYTIERREQMKEAVEAVRKSIPDGAIEAEREQLKHGKQQGLKLEIKPCTISERNDFMEALHKGIRL